ncbi:hypothetical protein [Mycobacterium montefiorense]|uniref:Uncharacterized protein n=1 Tax=Mycobacterium montefiorense TaxID=154654 RepID=A0AA37PI35_9MYCO|nr:hypothetical protein [Mycobacterium montefiorense]GBG37411.1 hypothetical protein MmonteBS_17830 [Mycobacterium montefiorense]GKU36642.1 hypothetical protein NJB14191_39880 [Mycobacterium montefiorense]GKU42173.1 hypothetical protein NJB14192_41560 [Mycobacterium montefiorense]GKU45900.1 hypothetical protein NJB14194_25210 [Mycobacterium montefiorense]GKU52908.1 hypothetical protein NJB14195_41490 [Mycobacterium montefiorense]
MAEFRAIDPRGKVVASKDFASAEAAHSWFIALTADSSELGWRMEVSDDGNWAHFDDTGGFTAPASRHPERRS